MMKKILLFFTLFLALISSDVFAQEQMFVVTGTVKDQNNEPLIGVYVTNGDRGAQTDREGRYVLKGLRAGTHTLKTMYYSAYPVQSKTIDLRADQTVDFVLKEDALHMDQVVVTGTRTERRLSEAPVQTILIKDREILKSGSTSTLEALQDNLPGIVISPNAMGNNMRIKGLNSRYILFLVDGERLVSEGAGGNINLDQIDVSTIDHVEVIQGAASALYGSNAVGAVVNIITKQPVHNFSAGASVTGESYNTWRTKLNVGLKSNKVSSHISAFRHSSDGYDKENYAARYEDYGTNLKLGYRPMERLDLNFNGRYFRHETFNPDNSFETTHGVTHTVALGANAGYTSKDQRNAMRLSVNWDKYFDFEVGDQSSYKHKDNTATYLSSRLTNSFKAHERFELVGGLEHNYECVFATKTLGPTPTTKSINDVNLFGQVDWEIFKHFNAVVGARYTYNEQFKSAFTPKLSLMYELGEFKFRGSVGSAFRAPSIKELYYDFDHQGMFWIHGNPDLKAEKGLYSSLSVEFTHKLFNASVSAYYNDIDDKITQYNRYIMEQVDGQSKRRNHKYYTNISSATLRGFDVSFSWIFLRYLTLKGSYSFCDAKDNATGLQLSSNVKHSGTVSLTWNGKIRRSPFSLQLAGRMNSPILYESQSTDSDGNQVIEREKSKSYSIWKATLVKPFRIKKHTLELTFKCDNLFEFKEESFVSPGRTFLFGLNYSFK